MKFQNRVAQLLFYRARLVPLADCVHYCGFRYGRKEFNPYERYIHGLMVGVPRDKLRGELLNFFLHFRPRNLGEALSVNLQRPPPLWHLPWKRVHVGTPRGWRALASEIPDLLTHFSEEGVPEEMIDQECLWIERAWSSINREGYRPESHSFIRVFELRGTERSAYIVADGNHRLSCLSASGVSHVQVILAPLRTAHRANSRRWPAVREGCIGQDDALRIFDAYFMGNHHPWLSDEPAPLVRAQT
jgi:hypothetical protein